ncbi:MAG TPA: hypothetical protein VFB38_05445 [Chthonomonadaceae bacterium]|nr:hypothetical protein [Chthonomonadaceae bacterium]
MSSIRQIKVTLTIFADERTGAEYILPDEADFAEEEARLEALEAEANGWLASKHKPTQARGKAQMEAVEGMRAALARQRATRERLLPHAQKRTFILKKPNYGAYLEAENAAKQLNQETGDVTVDQSLLMQHLLPTSIEGMTPAEVNDLAPNVVRHLWGKLYGAIWPDRGRLPFSCWPSETPLTDG